MSHALRHASTLAAALAGAAIAGDLRAEEPIEPIRLSYSAPATCPAFERFYEQISARALVRLAVEKEPARAFEVLVVARDGGHFATLSVQDLDGAIAVRQLSGATCEDLVAALALVVAVAVDPQALSRPPAEPPLPPEPPEPAPAPVGPAPVPPPERPAPRLPVSQPAPAELAVLVALGVGARTAIAPGLTPIGRVTVGVSTRGGEVEPAVRLSAARGLVRTIEADSGREVALDWTAGAVEGCAGVRLQRVVVEPCVGFGGGVLRGEGGHGTIPARSAPRPWLEVGAAGRARYEPAPFVVELGVEAFAPLRRDRFLLREPDETAHEVPVLGVGALLGVGVMIP